MSAPFVCPALAHLRRRQCGCAGIALLDCKGRARAMGVSWHHVKALVSAHKAGVNFERTLTVGRLNLFISPGELQKLIASSPGLPER